MDSYATRHENTLPTLMLILITSLHLLLPLPLQEATISGDMLYTHVHSNTSSPILGI